jgi:hypothetical protein
MEQFKSSLVIFGGCTRNFEEELNGGEPVITTEPEIHVCNLSKYTWSKVITNSKSSFLSLFASTRISETEFLIYGGIDLDGNVT